MGLILRLLEPDLELADDEQDEPYIGGVLPWLVPVGLDVHANRAAYLWLRIDWPGDTPESAAESYLGRPDEWVSDAVGSSYRDVLDIGWSESGHHDDWMPFMLREGIAPGQAFLIEIAPKWWTDYWGEHDVDWNTKVVAKGPCADPAAAWSAMLTAWSGERQPLGVSS